MRGRTLLLPSVAVVGLFALLLGMSVSATGAPTLTAKEELGKSIFFDDQLSINQNQSCATCHDPAAGWTGPNGAINMGGAVYEGSIPGRFGDRKPPSAAYATQAPILHMPDEGFFVGGNFWDGRATGEKLGNPAADQAQGPFLNPAEQALPDAACVVYRVTTASDYLVSFQDVWGPVGVTWPADVETQCATEGSSVVLSEADRALVSAAYDRIGLSIAAYEASAEVNAFTSKFDWFRMKLTRLSGIERQGLQLFNGKGKCSLCHISSGTMPLFTDYTYDNLGIPANPENPMYSSHPDFVDRGLGAFLESRTEYAEYAGENMGKFKVPTLRNVGLGLPGIEKAFGHNGHFKSLESIVHFYNTRDVLPRCDSDTHPKWIEGQDCWPAPEYPENVNTDELGALNLSPRQEAAIVAFLMTLSDGFMP